MGVLSQILVISTAIILSEAACGDKHRLAPGDEVTFEETYEGRSKNKCKNIFMCAERGSECDISVKCSEFSVSGAGRASRPCKKNFLKVQREKYCDETGPPDITEFSASKVKIMAKGTNYGFSCQISVKALVPSTTQGSDYGNYGNYGNYGSDYGMGDWSDYGMGNWSDYGNYGSDYGLGNWSDYGNYGSDYGMGNWSDYGNPGSDYGMGNWSDYGIPGSDYGMGNWSDYGNYGSDYGMGNWSDYGNPGSDYGMGNWSDYGNYGDYGNGSDYGGPLPTSAPATSAPPPPPVAPTTAGGSGGSCSCASYTPSADTRIVGGVAVDHGEFPWQASLRRYGSHSCGGTVVSPSWILTAAHCVNNGATADMFSVYLGGHHITKPDQGETEHRVTQIVMGPNNGDIALLKLATPATFNDKIQPACIPTSHASNAFEGKHLWVTGWGTMVQGGTGDTLSPELLKVLVPVVSNTVCAKNYAGQASIGANEICAGTPGKDSCQGDSGGPAVWADGPQNRAYIVGVVSWGIGCANDGFPGVYARVTSYLDWIRSTTKGDSICEA